MSNQYSKLFIEILNLNELNGVARDALENVRCAILRSSKLQILLDVNNIRLIFELHP